MVFFVCLIAVPQGVAGREYRTAALHHAAIVLGIERQIDDAADDTTTSVATTSGITIDIRIDSNGKVDHIGLPLFSSIIRQQNPSPVYDCMEYAVLDRLYRLSENDFQLQKILFSKGSWKSLLDIKLSDEFTIVNQDWRYYQLTWSRDSNETIKVVVPIDYELLSGSSRRELEKNFVHDISCHSAADNKDSVKEIEQQLAKSDLEVDVQLSNYDRHTLNVTFRQWLSYCESIGCTTDIKYDDSGETAVKGYVISKNSAMGYHHLLELTWQTGIYSKVKGKALLFIPNYDKI